MLAFFIYKSAPWKQPIWTNRPLFIVLAINIALILVISFTTDSLSDLEFQPIATTQVLVVYVIMIMTGIVCAAFNIILDKLCFRNRYLERSELS